jgi:hypothetical protein
MKYVMIDNIHPILFTEAMNHKDFIHRGNITSAGMCKINVKINWDRYAEEYDIEKTVRCYGKSISLNLEPAEQDAERIKKFLLEWED